MNDLLVAASLLSVLGVTLVIGTYMAKQTQQAQQIEFQQKYNLGYKRVCAGATGRLGDCNGQWVWIKQ